MEYRTEKDSLGEMQVPADAYYGVHTLRSLNNFQISRLRAHPQLNRAIALIKQACAEANMELETLNVNVGNAVVQACQEIAEGRLADQFCLDVFQAGSGTSQNMHINEIIGNRAAEILGGKRGDRSLVHPNDHVNKGQSTNNVFPSGIRLAALTMLGPLSKALGALHHSLTTKAAEFNSIVKSGRTHLQDAVPITLGQEFQGYAESFSKDEERLQGLRGRLGQIGVGGNAVGTGLNTYPEFRELIIRHLRRITGLDVIVPANGIEITNSLTDMAECSATVRLIAINLQKLANDLRLLSSGPNTGLREIMLPAVEPGSSIMPGKINPSICEAVNMACMQVFGNDQTVAVSAQAGQLELNTHMPVVGHNLLESIEIMTNALSTMAHKCIDGITADTERCAWYLDHSMGLATALNPMIGYDKAAQVVKDAVKGKKTIKEVILEQQIMPPDDLKALFEPRSLTAPNLKRKK